MCHTLIIEDEWLIASLLAELAEEAGATSVALAATEDDAVREARARLPEFIMSDVRLREGTGPHAVDRIRKEFGPIPVIFMTAIPEECHPCDYALAVLPKPITNQDVIDTFRRYAPL